MLHFPQTCKTHPFSSGRETGLCQALKFRFLHSFKQCELLTALGWPGTGPEVPRSAQLHPTPVPHLLDWLLVSYRLSACGQSLSSVSVGAPEQCLKDHHIDHTPLWANLSPSLVCKTLSCRHSLPSTLCSRQTQILLDPARLYNASSLCTLCLPLLPHLAPGVSPYRIAFPEPCFDVMLL